MSTHFDTSFPVTIDLMLEARSQDEAYQRASDALKDGLIEPGFAVEGIVREESDR